MKSFPDEHGWFTCPKEQKKKHPFVTTTTFYENIHTLAVVSSKHRRTKVHLTSPLFTQGGELQRAFKMFLGNALLLAHTDAHCCRSAAAVVCSFLSKYTEIFRG